MEAWNREFVSLHTRLKIFDDHFSVFLTFFYLYNKKRDQFEIIQRQTTVNVRSSLNRYYDQTNINNKVQLYQNKNQTYLAIKT